jgi:hypothetical protein
MACQQENNVIKGIGIYGLFDATEDRNEQNKKIMICVEFYSYVRSTTKGFK